MLLGVGDHWTLDYTPTWTLYSNNRFHDTLNHAVRLIGATTHDDWTLSFWQTYQRSSAPLVETAQQTDQETYLTTLNASHPVNSRISLDFSGSQNLRFALRFTDSLEWSTMDWLNYQFWPRLTAGVGFGVGYVNVTPGFDQIYEQYQARINWRATDKLVFQAHGGVEERQFFDPLANDLNNPIFGASVQYQPFDVTTISLNANRAVSTSYFTNQVTESTSINVSLNQRLLEKLYLALSSGYQIVTYTSATSGASGRRDEYYSINVRLSSTFLKRGTVAAFYQFSSNSSNQGGFGYSSSQTGFEVGYKY